MIKNIYHKAFLIIINKAFLLLIFFFVLFSQKSFSQSHKTYNDSIQKHYNFILAASNGNVEEVNKAIKKGVYINHRDADGGTALFYAVGAEHAEIVKILLYYDADPNIGLHNGFSPLMNASSFSFEMAKLLLLKPQTKLDIYDVYKSTAIHYAAYYGQYQTVDMLLFYGANAELKSENNTCIITLATYSGDTSLLSLLIDAGSKPFEFNNDNISSLNVAIQFNDSALLDFLLFNNDAITFIKANYSNLINDAIKQNNIYAFEKIIALNDSSKIINSRKLYHTAYIYNNDNAVEALENKGQQKPFLPIPYSVFMSFHHSFNADDYSSYFGIGMLDARYNISLSLNYGTRFKPKAFLDKIDENTFYQHWERRNIFAIQLRKDISIYDNKNIGISPFIATDIQWHWVRYNGRSKKINGEAHFVPELGISFRYSNIALDISYQYANNKIYDVSPHRFNIGIKGSIPFYSKPKKYYPLWM